MGNISGSVWSCTCNLWSVLAHSGNKNMRTWKALASHFSSFNPFWPTLSLARGTNQQFHYTGVTNDSRTNLDKISICFCWQTNVFGFWQKWDFLFQHSVLYLNKLNPNTSTRERLPQISQTQAAFLSGELEFKVSLKLCVYLFIYFYLFCFWFGFCVFYRRTDLKQLWLWRRAWTWKNVRLLSRDLKGSNRFV